jgi:predicted phosphoribosyltransferase
MLLQNRRDAGRKLASHLKSFAQEKPIVLGIPRGGVVVAGEVSKALEAPLYVCIVRKLGAPHNPEVAIGAVMPDGTAVLDTDIIDRLHIPQSYIDKVITEELKEIHRRQSLYQVQTGLPEMAEKTAILVDDGIATGYTIEAAVRGLRNLNPKAIIIAVPVAPGEVVDRLRGLADDVICLDTPEPFYAVGQFYEDFNQTNDEEVIKIIHAAEKIYT